jgi:hypothetical protein
MGIKFHCPQGHKLNVKAFLAGKRGVCPKCGSKLRIPSASEPGLDGEGSDEPEETDAAHSAASRGNGSGVVAEAIATRHVASQVAAPAVAAAPLPYAADTAPASQESGSAIDDPIAQQPTAIWYVRPPTGGQYGPARGDVMRRWLAEGRVSGDSLVWREGWTDWQTASKLFPQLLAPDAAAEVASRPAPARQASLAPRSSARTAARYQSKQQSTSALAIGIVIGLAALCAVLIGVLVYLWLA